MTDADAIGEREYRISLRGETILRSHAPTDHAVLVAESGAASALSDLTEELGFQPQRVGWLAGRRPAGIPKQSVLTPSAIIAGNLKQLAREHRSVLDDEQPRRSPDAPSDNELPSLETLEPLIANASWKSGDTSTRPIRSRQGAAARIGRLRRR